jgi:TonB-linked SusC/RagA family outer membrane protein
MKNNYSRLKWVALIIIGGILFFLSKSATAAPTSFPLLQQQEVSGIVKDQNGIPIPGVTVKVKNTNLGTVTNLDGEYNITAPENGILIFTYIGYKTAEIPIDNNEEISIQLEEDISSLGEVKINAGYYNTTERARTGNISRVTAEEIEFQPVVSPIEALAGRMAGVQIIPGGNLPGGATTIRIRGINSLRQEGNLPLYIIDGVPVNSAPIQSNSNLDISGIDPLNNINVSNIQSIEILKDADATAIYGSRGANGVVLITTKQGKIGKTEFQARVYSGVSEVPNRVDLLNTQEYLQIRRAALENDGIEPTETNAYDLTIWDQDRYTDWQEMFFGGSAPVTDINLHASGGNERTTFRLSGSFHNQGTVYLGDYDYDKVTAGAHLSHTTENRKFHLDLSVNYGADQNKLAGYLNLTGPAFTLPPNAPPVFNDDSSLNWDSWSEVGINNPLTGFFNTGDIEGRTLNSNLLLSYEVLNGLELKSSFGYTTYHGDELIKRPKRSFNPSSSGGSNHRSTHLITQRKSWIIEPQLTYNAEFGKLDLNAIIGGTFQRSENANLNLQGEGYVSESLIGNLSAAERIISGDNLSTDYKYNAIFGRLGFQWDDKYYLNFTGRRDGSSRFGPGKRLANFGAIGAAWIFTEEKFIKNALPFISFGKFRGSYGTTGNDQIGDYGYFDAYIATIGPGGLYPNQLSNPDYSWEINRKLEAAVQLGFNEDKINLGISWYRNRSSNQLVGYTLPATTGFSSVQANLPATVENTGFEIEFSSLNIKTKNFQWQSSFNLTLPENKLVSYPGIEESSYANTYRVGEPLNIALQYRYEGIDPETGYYQVADINGDGSFDYDDRIIPWDRGRKLFGGISNSFKYKNFSLQFLWQFVEQEGILGLFNGGLIQNQRRDVFQSLQDDSDFQQISTSLAASQAYNNVLSSNFPVVNASFLRLKTMNISYSLPSSLVENIGLSSGKFFINGLNLLTLTPYEGIDPEMPGIGTSFSALRTVTGGIQVNF